MLSLVSGCLLHSFKCSLVENHIEQSFVATVTVYVDHHHRVT